MPRRNLEIFGSFPSAAWTEAFCEDLYEAERVRIASGFTNLRGVRELLDVLDPKTKVDFLLGLAGCEGPDVVRELQARAHLVVRASLVSDFHWKTASIQGSTQRALYIGSANFTSKGFGGSGEIMLRLSGSVLTPALWDTFHTNFDAFFAEGTTLFGTHLLRALETVEGRADAARGAQAELETAVENEIHNASTGIVLAARRTWFVQWNDDFTPAEQSIIVQALGVCPSEWTRGEIEEPDAQRITRGDVVVAYKRNETFFVLGQLGRLEFVQLRRNSGAWLMDLRHLAIPITSEDHPKAYASIRRALASTIGRNGVLASDQYRAIIAVLQDAGLIPDSNRP